MRSLGCTWQCLSLHGEAHLPLACTLSSRSGGRAPGTRQGRRHWAARLRFVFAPLWTPTPNHRHLERGPSSALTRPRPGSACCKPSPNAAPPPATRARCCALSCARSPQDLLPLLAVRCLSAAPDDCPHPGQPVQRPPGNICHTSRHEVPFTLSNQCRAHVTPAGPPRKCLTPRLGEVHRQSRPCLGPEEPLPDGPLAYRPSGSRLLPLEVVN